MNWKAIGAALVTYAGVVVVAVAHSGANSLKGAGIVALGAIIQAFTGAVHQGPGTVISGTTDDGLVVPKGTTILPTPAGSGVRLSTGTPVVKD